MILASASPRRREILTRCGVGFTAESADVAELRPDEVSELRMLPQFNAELKASAVARKHPQELVLGADTAIFFEGKIIGKPQSLAQAAEFLRAFSGKEHEVITGMALVRGSDREVWSESSFVRFKVLDDRTIADYLSQVQVLDKAGAYAIQEHGDLIVASYRGEFDNIVGLPVKTLMKRLICRKEKN